VSKTKELIVDYRKRLAKQVPININSAVVDQVESFKFLGVHITNKMSWSKHTKTVVERLSDHKAEGNAYGPVHHWGQASCHPGPIFYAVSEEGPNNCQRFQSTKS
jgi:hypothetical protein